MAEDKTALGLPKNTTAALAYVLGWVTGLIVFLMEKQDKFVRFHALQSMVVFGCLHILMLMAGWMLYDVLRLIWLVLLLLLAIKAYQGEKFKLPVIGDFVEKQIGK